MQDNKRDKVNMRGLRHLYFVMNPHFSKIHNNKNTLLIGMIREKPYIKKNNSMANLGLFFTFILDRKQKERF